jgi:hypothetical protein
MVKCISILCLQTKTRRDIQGWKYNRSTRFEQSLAEFYTIILEEYVQVSLEIL